jgi:HEAT repeat protein
LIKALAGGDAGMRYHALSALGWVGPEAAEAWPSALKALADLHEDVRRKAAFAVGRIAPQPDAAVRVLIRAFQDPSGPVREAAAAAAAQLGAPAVPVLMEALADPAVAVRLQVVRALGDIGDEARIASARLRIALLEPDDTLQAAAALALAKIGSAAVPVLAQALKSDNPGARGRVLEALAKVGPTGVPVVVEALGDKRVDVRRKAAEVLGPLGFADRFVVAGLAAALKDPDELVRWNALGSLKQLGRAARPAVPALKAALLDTSLGVRRDAYLLLEGLGEQPRDQLLRDLEGKDERARFCSASVLVLVKCEAEKATPVLVHALAHPDINYRLQAASVLAWAKQHVSEVIPVLVAGVREKDASLRHRAVRGLAYLGPEGWPAVPALLEIVKGKDVALRQRSLHALAAIGGDTRAVVPAMQVALLDRDVSTRVAVVQVLGRHGKEALPLYLEAVNDPQAAVRLAAAQGLAACRGEAAKVVPALNKLLSDENVPVRLAALETLRQFGKDALPSYLDALRDRNAVVVRAALKQLHEIKAENPADILAAVAPVLTNPDPEARALVFEVVGRLGEPGLPLLLTRLKDRDDEIRLLTVKALKNLGKGSAKAMPTLNEMLTNDGSASVRLAAVEIMTALGTEVAPELLKLVREGKDEGPRTTALCALAAMPAQRQALLPLALAAAKEKSAAVRLAAVEALCRLGSDEARLALTDALDDDAPAVRRRALDALVDLGVEGIPALTQALKSKDLTLRLRAMNGLGRQGAPARAAVPALVEALSDPNPSARWAAATALGRIGLEARDALPALTRAAQGADLSLRLYAQAAVLRVGGP